MTSQSMGSLPPVMETVEGGWLDHVGVAVHDVRSAAAFYRDHLGAQYVLGGENPAGGFVFAHYRFPGGGTVELLQPFGEGAVARRLGERGEGFHHMTIRVRDLASQVTRLRESGLHPRGVRLDGEGWNEAFLVPQESHGILVQLLEIEDGADPFDHLQRFRTELDLFMDAPPGDSPVTIASPHRISLRGKKNAC